MAGNKFATMLHRNTHKVAVILVYTLLEWTLIALLLINAVFSYLIFKFAAFFGLHRPCILCSRVDHVFEEGKSYRDFLCDAHAGEVSRLGFCSRHRRLVEAKDMCEDCSAFEMTSVLSWMRGREAGEKDLSCSCCGVVLKDGFFSNYLLLKPSWGVLGVTQKGNWVENGMKGEDFDPEGEKEDGGNAGFEEKGVKDEEEEEHEDDYSTIFMGNHVSPQPLRDSDGELAGSVPAIESMDNCIPRILEMVNIGEEHCFMLPAEEAMGDCSADSLLVEHEEINVVTEDGVCIKVEALADDDSGVGLVPVELIDSITMLENPILSHSRDDSVKLGHDSIEIEILDGTTQILGMGNIAADHPSVLPTEDRIGDCSEPEEIHAVWKDGFGIEVEALAEDGSFGEFQGITSEDESKGLDTEINCEISIGSEICDQEQSDPSHFHEPVLMPLSFEVQCSYERDQEIEIETVETIRGAGSLSICPDLNKFEEERTPETPTSFDGIHALHKRFFFERRECGSESLDGSISGEIEGSETLTMDHLKAALKAERNALSSLYAELEEERSASAVAANQTMAMITRLQEEKAAMQMDFLQYQRMMEELTEYDQEALQLMNELMVKREKEKQDLEKELEFYQEKVILYESKERRTMTRSKANGMSATSSASSSGEDSDDISFDCHESDECFNTLAENNLNTPADEADNHPMTLDESLSEFEEERGSILERLKALEDELFILDDEDSSDNVETMDHFSKENGLLNEEYKASRNNETSFLNGFSIDLNSNGKLHGDGFSIDLDSNGKLHGDGFSIDLDSNGKLHGERRSMGRRGKTLLPLFDAISMDNEGEQCIEESASKWSMGHKKLATAEEVDNVYERLQNLEADREFLKHCMSSLKKGDKGMDLLQEILQHLRDLRSGNPSEECR